MLYGRDRELADLSALLERARAGRGGTLVLRGEVGVGKSALLAEAATIAVSRGVHVSRGSTLDGPDRPVLLIADDAQRMDEPSWAALTFLGRRLPAEPVLLLIAVRDGAQTERRLATAGLPELPIGPLADPGAAALLDHTAPGLGPAARQRVLAEAMGNPLALLEFGVAAARHDRGAPLSARVERTLGALIAELPARTRTVLLVASLDDGDGLDEILAAAASLDAGVSLADVEPAVAAGLVSVDDGFRLRLRHPLLRPALRQGASPSERGRVHGALAGVLAADPDRQVWHRAAMATGPDEALAGELAGVAARTQARDADAARVAMERAAELSPDPRLRSSRLLRALEIAEQQGHRDGVTRLIDGLDATQLGPSEQARLSWIGQTALGRPWTGAGGTTIVDRTAHEGDVERAKESLLSLAVRLYWSNPDSRTRQLLAASADGLEGSTSDPRMLCVLAAAQPIERGAEILRALHELMGRVDVAPRDLSLLGSAATGTGALHLAAKFFAAATVGLRAQERMGTLSWALMGQAWTAAQVGDVRLGLAVATEARDMASESGQPLQSATAGLALGQVEALRGNESAALELAGQGERALLAAGADAMLGMVALVRGCAALGSGRPAEAYRHLSRLFELPTPVHLQSVALGHLAEAAVQCGQLAGLRPVVDRLGPLAEAGQSPILGVTLAYARAVQTDDGFAAALSADLADWPFERARLQLAYGSWLRGRRKQAEARRQLRSAAAVFDALGARAWGDRARRLAGGPQLTPGDAREGLTPQELQVARLAAKGLSNREIAERLSLSPRTVTTHLSRIFPKLGISSRRELSLVQEIDPPAQNT